MATKKAQSVVGIIGETVGDFVDAASVAATGSQVGVLELAAEEEMSSTRAKRKRQAKPVRKKKKFEMKTKKKTRKKRSVKRSHR
jgi:hypothetical protein